MGESVADGTGPVTSDAHQSATAAPQSVPTTPQSVPTTPAAVLAVDAGGTHTRAVLADPQGRILGRGRAGSGNPFSVGSNEAAVTAIVDACTQAVAAASPATISQVMVTMAGAAALGGELPGLADALAQAEIYAAISLASDALSIYFSATTEPDGGVLIAGTGAVAVRVVHGEVADLIDGSGWLIGDEGSGFWIGRRVVQAVAADLDGRGPQTALTAAVLDSLPALSEATPIVGTAERTRLIRGIYALRPTELAQFAPLAFHVDDDQARQIIADAGTALAHTLHTLVARLDQPGLPVVIGGGLSTTSLGDALLADLADLGGRGLRAADGCIGAVVLALRAAGLEVTEVIRAHLASELN